MSDLNIYIRTRKCAVNNVVLVIIYNTITSTHYFINGFMRHVFITFSIAVPAIPSAGKIPLTRTPCLILEVSETRKNPENIVP